MGIEENKGTLRREFEEIWNKGDLSVVSDLISPNYFYRYPYSVYEGIDGFNEFVKTWHTAFPDLKMTIDDMVGEADALAVRVSWSGTFTSKLGPFEPNGKKIEMKEAWFFRFDNGKDMGFVPYANLHSMFQQMDVVPPIEEIGN